MSTPDFVAQSSSNFTTIRMYTASDPYYYTVDNRPLTDIQTNLQNDRQWGADGARRAALIGALNMGSMFSEQYAVPAYSAATYSVAGFNVGNPTTNVITVGPGAVYQVGTISATVTNPVMKQYLSIATNSFTLTAPVTGGTSIVYLVEGQLITLSQTSMATTQLPYMDSTNPYLPSTLQHGEVQFQVIAGTAATTGTQTAPTTTSGWFPLYYVTLTQGTTAPVNVQIAPVSAGGPFTKVIEQYVTPVVNTGTTLAVSNEMVGISFPASAVSSVCLPLRGNLLRLNPSKPLYLKLSYSPSVTANTFVIRLRYFGYTIGTLVTTAKTNTSSETITVSAAVNAVADYVTTVAIIPNTAFAGWVSNNWTINVEALEVVLERQGTSDTNTGNLVLLNAVFLQ